MVKKKGKQENVFFSNKVLMPLLFILTIWQYSNTFNHEFTLDDDIVYPKNKFVLKGIEGISEIFSYGYLYGFNGNNDQSYRPLTLLTFALEQEFFQTDPHASHVVNVFLYAIAIIILLLFLKRIFSNYPPPVYFAVVLLFLVHPIHTEVVASVKSRDEILSFLFGVLSLYLCLKYIDKAKLHLLVAGLFSYLLAILSKESILTFLAVVPLILYFFTKEKIKKIVIVTGAYLASLLGYLYVRSLIMESMTFEEDMDIINNTLMGASSINEEWATNFVILGNYFKLLFIPYPLSWDYSFSYFKIVDFTDFRALLVALISLLMGVWAVLNIKKRNIYAFAVLFFFITFSVSSNFVVKIGATLGERFMFTPSLAVAIILPVALYQINEKFKLKPFYWLGGVILIGVIFFSLTYNRSEDWKNNYNLFKSGLEVTPESARVQSSMASEYRVKAEKATDPKAKQRFYAKAIAGYKKSVEIYPKYVSAWYNLGVSYHFSGKLKAAVNAYWHTLDLYEFDLNALNNLGSIYFNGGKLDSAAFYFKKMLHKNPNHANGLANMGAIYHHKKDLDKAISYYEKSLKINPYNANTLNNMVKACNLKGDKKRAIEYAKRLQQLRGR